MPIVPAFETQDSRNDSWRSVLANPFDGVLLFDDEGRYVEANGVASSILGVPHDQLVGRQRGGLAVSRQAADDFWFELLRVGHAERTLGIIRPDGVTSSIECRARANFAPGLHLVLIRDITESSSTGSDFRLLAEAMPQIVWITRADGWNVYFNQKWMEYTGLTLEESLGHGWNKPFHPEDQLRAWEAWRNATTTLATYSVDCRLRGADGEYRWWLIRGVPVRDDFGKILKWFGTCTDIHDLKMAQLDIDTSRARFASVFNSQLLAIAIVEATSGRFVDLNERYADFFGYARDEMIGRTSLELGLWGDAEAREAVVAAAIGVQPPAAKEVTFRHRSGESRHALMSMESIDWAGETERILIQVIVDIQERKVLESQLIQAQKMEAVGRLAGGVAHDFNNALGVIIGYTEMLLRGAAAPERGRLEQILKASQSAASMTRQLLAFSRKEIVSPKALDLNVVLSDLEKMLGRLIGEDIDLAITTGESLGSVMIDPGQLEQVVMNLCINSRDAMPDGGLLRLETTNVDVDAQYISPLELVVPGRYVMLAVSDSGCGIDKEIQAKIFEPFFTTKERGKGTGLGLATVYGIVKQCGGHIAVYSEVGHGTTFKVYLPRVDAAATETLAEEAFPVGGSETVLLVEDEESLRTIAVELLEENGYRVLVAAHGAEAQETFRRHSEPIHLLITDVVMPGMNGRALAESLVSMRPSLKVLYMSGYTDDIISQKRLFESGAHLLQKPFSTRALLQEVRAALGDPSRGETT